MGDGYTRANGKSRCRLKAAVQGILEFPWQSHEPLYGPADPSRSPMQPNGTVALVAGNPSGVAFRRRFVPTAPSAPPSPPDRSADSLTSGQNSSSA